MAYKCKDCGNEATFEEEWIVYGTLTITVNKFGQQKDKEFEGEKEQVWCDECGSSNVGDLG